MPDVGRQIRAARESLQLPALDVARMARMPPERLREIEAGAPPFTHELYALADVLAIEPGALVSGRLNDSSRSVARFRAAHGIQETTELLCAHDVRLLARAAELGRVGAYLCNALEMPPLGFSAARRPLAVRPQPEAWRQGYELGKEARRSLFPEPGPILSVQQIIESFGIHVAFVSFEAGAVEAASLFEPGALPIVLLNKSIQRIKYRLARRAILAHELCHILHDGGEQNLVTVVSRRLDDSPVEQRANGFAPNFVAPEGSVAVRHREPRRIVTELGATWGLSFEGATWHAKNLQLISADVAERLLAGSGRRIVGEAEFEPVIPRTPPDQFGLPARLTDLVTGYVAELTVRAFAEGIISRGRAAELLSFR